MNLEKVQVGIIGYGFSASVFHIPILKTIHGFEVTKVVSSDASKVRVDLPNAEVVATPEKLFEDPEIELVVITTPNTLHYPLAKGALTAGKHVVVDKPFVVEESEAIDLIEIAAKHQRCLSVYHNRRWDNDFLTLQHVIDSGVLGNVCVFESHMDRYRPVPRKRWREEALPGSGLLYDLGPHLIDQAVCLFGMPRSVYADMSIQRESGKTDDYFHLLLEYDHLRVILHAGSLVRAAGPRFQVHGDKGSFIKYGVDSQEALLKAGFKPGDAGWGADPKDQFAVLTTGGDIIQTATVETIPGSYESYYSGMLDAILGRGEVPVPAEAGLHTIQIIQRAMKSHMAGQRIVT